MTTYSEVTLDLIFAKAKPTGVDGMSYDCDGRVICRWQYGTTSLYGWHVDHTVPTAVGGLDVISNLRPRHWEGNTRAGGRLGGILGLGLLSDRDHRKG